MPVPTTTLDVDPLAKVLEPPPDETPAESEARLVAEAKAKHVSERIDEEIEKEKAAEKRKAKALKMLLLGQSESVQTDLLKLKMRLAPLLQVEHALTRRLAPEGGFAEEEAILHDREASYADRSHLVREVAINSTCAWKEILGTSSRTSEKNEETPDGHNSSDPSILLNACAQDMQILWNDSTVKTLLKRNNIHMEEVAGFFLDSLERVTALDYIPSDGMLYFVSTVQNKPGLMTRTGTIQMMFYGHG
ncbi:hypothetical protein C0989_003404 [Termitomyces sp. Mn162]|nr:hypothetical protein C0989_003404 [Termitomyces sp. Mn162]